VLDGRIWYGHRRAFERRWVRRWGEPLVGVWVKEFQSSGRPHLHLYVGLPSGVSDEDFAWLRDRTLERQRLQRKLGRYQGRRQTPPLALGEHGSPFGAWLLSAWSEIVGTASDEGWKRIPDPKGSDYHRQRGADVAVMFWSDEAEAGTDRTRVAQYLAGEAAKFAQKQPPPDFYKIGRYYGTWGRGVGFKPETTLTVLDPAVALEVETRLLRWVRWKLHVLRRGVEPSTQLGRRVPGALVELLGSIDPETGEILLSGQQEAAAGSYVPATNARGRSG
jgi:hypothetical protein